MNNNRPLYIPLAPLRGVRHAELQLAVGEDGYIVVVDGYQWGHDPAQFHHDLGCSGQVYPSAEAARLAWEAAGR